MRAKLGVVVLVVVTGTAALTVALLRDGGEEVSLATAGQESEPTTTAKPQAPVTMDGVAPRLDCPDPPDPNGPAPNPPGPGNLVHANYDYAAGNGEPTPEAAVELFASSTWPGLDPGTFVATVRSPIAVRYENRHAALLVTGIEGGIWVVSNAIYCGTIAAEWRAGRK